MESWYFGDDKAVAYDMEAILKISGEQNTHALKRPQQMTLWVMQGKNAKKLIISFFSVVKSASGKRVQL